MGAADNWILELRHWILDEFRQTGSWAGRGQVDKRQPAPLPERVPKGTAQGSVGDFSLKYGT